MQLTNSAEAAAFFLARAIVIALLYVANIFLLSPLYMEMFRSRGAAMVSIVAWSVTLLSWVVTLLLFLAFRAGFGGVPSMVAGQDRRNAVTSSGGEIGAFILAVVIVIVLGTLLTTFVLARVYVSLGQSGVPSAVAAASLVVSALMAVVFFLIFIALRSGMSSSASADGELALYDGGPPMGFGRAITTCLRKYAVFSGRASRSEYWWFVLFQALVVTPPMVVDVVAFHGAANIFSTFALLILLLPYLAVSVRRLHDIDMSGWFFLISLIPFVGWIVMVVFACQRGTAGANRFGMGPASTSIPEVFA